MKPRTTTGWLILIGAGLLLLAAVAALSTVRVRFEPAETPPPHTGAAS